MSFEGIRSAIAARMSSNWSTTPIAWENRDFTPPTSGGWVELTVLGNTGQTRGINGDVGAVRDSGLIAINIYTPEGSGTATGRGYADTLAALFEHERFSGITTYAATLTTRGVVNGWHQLNLTIPYRSNRNV